MTCGNSGDERRNLDREDTTNDPEQIRNPTNQTLHRPPPLVPPTTVKIDGQSFKANTTECHPGNGTAQKRDITALATSTKATFLVFARDAASAYSAYSGLNDYGIPYELILVPSNGITLPQLKSSDIVGNYGGFVILSEVSYKNSAGNWGSAITANQWQAMYDYQVAFGARMVRLDVVPSASSGTRVVGSCCGDTQDQTIYIADTSQFPTAGLKTGATMSTLGLYHYPAAVIDSTTTTSVVNFGPTTGFSDITNAVVINNFSGRKQMVFFLPMATDWALTSTVLTHVWIHWATRGLFDDMFLTTTLFNGGSYRVSTSDLATHIQWTGTVGAKMPAGSNYTMEIGHNGNGNIEISFRNKKSACKQGNIVRPDPVTVPLEYVKPVGTGTSLWPVDATNYSYADDCLDQDPLSAFFQTPNIRDSFMHVSHTFTHEDENTATYDDVMKEITWNQRWMSQIGFANGKWFSGRGIIPPAITGLHNGDALRAWKEKGIVNVVGDNTRSALLNTVNEHWPLITTLAASGFDGIQITPRWATNIFYNCDDAACDSAQWNSVGGTGDFPTLIAAEKTANARHLLRLHHDAFMFHQANLRWEGVAKNTINGVSGQYSLLQMWVESIVAEVTRLVTWPIISMKHDDLATTFANRMMRDKCNYSLTYLFGSSSITGVTIGAPSVGHQCGAAIPVTVPGPILDTGIVYNTEKVGSDPATIWIDLKGREVTLRLKDALPW
ncbi:hypothetical protein HYALB_00013605 [Hymenoscyphus albidus]|uniref:Extracellular serine-rich protein n=1 Tax=Hymenoscyphus albidus TaxID=595503 RepID=A0A9N9LRS1_9HELO|nr:hypothetical protein HYALB_00013605 [Hymenoscyphus albidus]